MIDTMPTSASPNPTRMMLAGAQVLGELPGGQRDGEHRERERRERQAGLHRVVLERHLQVQRQGDHRPAERDLLEDHRHGTDAEVLDLEQVGVEQDHLAGALAPHEPEGERGERHGTDRHEQPDVRAALLPHEDPQHDATHAEHRQHRAADVDLAHPRERHVDDELDVEQDDRDDHDLEHEADPPRQVRGDEAAEQRSDRRADRGRGADQRVGLLHARHPRSCRG